MSAAPIPVPMVMTRALSQLRAAPFFHSATPAHVASLSTTTGIPNLLDSSSRIGICRTSGRCGARYTTPSRDTVPGIPTPSDVAACPIRNARATHKSATSSTTPTPAAVGSVSESRTEPSLLSATAKHLVPPTSTPIATMLRDENAVVRPYDSQRAFSSFNVCKIRFSARRLTKPGSGMTRSIERS